VEELQSMITKLIVSQKEQKSILLSLIQQKKLHRRVSTPLISALNVDIGGNLLLPDLVPYMPLSSDICAYLWGATERGTSASGNLLDLLNTWVTYGAVPNIGNQFIDTQPLFANNSADVFVDFEGTFRKMPDAIGLRSTVSDINEICSISSSAIVSVNWETPTEFANARKMSCFGHGLAIAFANLSRRSIPVFITDMSSGFKCWIFIESKLYYLHRIDGQCLTLIEGIALMRYFLVRSEVIESTAQNINGSLSHCITSSRMQSRQADETLT
jgi:hypothetical protein